MVTWNPKTYLEYAEERTRPARDLLRQVKHDSPETVYDLGCGPGNSTELLAQRWPRAELTAIDTSEDMLNKARQRDFTCHWKQADIADWRPHAPVDVLFSNATLHWLCDHEQLFPKLMGFLRPQGVLAIQMPRNFTSASHTIIQQVVECGPWADELNGIRDFNPVSRPEVYYNILAPSSSAIDIWETEYIHPLQGENAVYHWIEGTALRPYLSHLSGEARQAFIEECQDKLNHTYRQRDDGVTLFPFRRLFIVAQAA